MLGGRVKTLHPRIHAGILARRDLPEDTATLAEHEIEPFDLVCVNLYPFTSVAGRRGVDRGRGGRDDRRRRPVDAARRGEELRARRRRLAGPTSTTSCSASCASTARSRSTRGASSRARRSRHGRLRSSDRELVRRDGAVPRAADAHLPEGDRPLLRREPASGGRLLPRGRRPAASALEGRAARRQGALVQQPRRPRGCTPDPARVRAAGRGDRQAREPLRSRGRGHGRGGVGARARRGPCLCIRLRRRAQPARLGGARRAHRRALRRSAARARLRRPRGRRVALEEVARGSSPTASAVRRRRASATSSACSAACSCRSATATSRTARRWRSSAAR